MREILFRGKNEYKGWVYGDLRNYEKSGAKAIFSHELLHRVEVDPSTVGQFTGLTDKNGKKIFEGDIVRHYNRSDAPGLYSMGKIFWNEKSCQFRRTTNTYREIVNISADCVYEVIGNIHDNPELLEV